ncbi:S-adenosylmethionine/S-adenosylhomocysteine transporter [Phaeobacter sp. CECT 5382]|uniref:DMT family transporter n=1 Tax=Phaeobacter sp. CECT 5382 TaxID=1712645 RepID=UPI0006DA96C9|nr:DMT family transporter [Phaeobacter sp. CECT 5382]CUH87654.1 S-adenosylmethionine/S-adenosylhomocysteine transporter [Phaeobacter sp. CECT 5382]
MPKSTAMIMTEPTARHWLMIATLGLVWGSTFMVIELALQGITPVWLTAGRILFAALLLGSLWAARGFRLFLGQPNWGMLVVLGCSNAVLPFLLISWGQQFVTSGFTGVSMAGTGLLVLPLAHFLIPGESMTKRRFLGFSIGFLGVATLIGAQAFDSTGSPLEPLGRAACLGAAACYAMSSILTRRLPAIDPVGLAASLLCIASVLIVPIAWVSEGPPPLPDRETLFWIAILGLLPTAAANYLRVLVIRSVGPTFMSLTSYQVPVWSVLLGALFLGEPLPATLLLALGLILTGVCISQWGALKRLFSIR